MYKIISFGRENGSLEIVDRNMQYQLFNYLSKANTGELELFLQTLDEEIIGILNQTSHLNRGSFTDFSGFLPLHTAIRWGKYESAKLLFEFGASPDLKDSSIFKVSAMNLLDMAEKSDWGFKDNQISDLRTLFSSK